jgi:hypothetical protein
MLEKPITDFMTTTHPHVETNEVNIIITVLNWNATYLEPFSQVPKLPILKQLLQDEKIDVYAIQEIRAGSISIPGYETMIFPTWPDWQEPLWSYVHVLHGRPSLQYPG